MPRSKTISDERLLAVARQVFVSQGYQSPVAQIARRAGVSEATVFKRFDSKKQLFDMAMNLHGNGAMSLPVRGPTAMCSSVRDTLLAYGRTLLTELCEVMPCLFVAASQGQSFLRRNVLSGWLSPTRHIETLTVYLSLSLPGGCVRVAPATMLADMFVSTLFCRAAMSCLSRRPMTSHCKYVGRLTDQVLGLWNPSGLALDRPMRSKRTSGGRSRTTPSCPPVRSGRVVSLV
jgi:hypothetical protein